MSRKRKAFVVYVDLDEVPGTMHSQESAQAVIRNVLYQRMASYNPMVSLAPADLQPEESDVLPAYNMCVESLANKVRTLMDNSPTSEKGTN